MEISLKSIKMLRRVPATTLFPRLAKIEEKPIWFIAAKQVLLQGLSNEEVRAERSVLTLEPCTALKRDASNFGGTLNQARKVEDLSTTSATVCLH